MSLLIDADYIVYKSCAAAEVDLDFGDDVIVVTSKFSDAMALVRRELNSIAECLGHFDHSILFFSDSKISGKKSTRNTRGIETVRSPVDTNG